MLVARQPAAVRGGDKAIDLMDEASVARGAGHWTGISVFKLTEERTTRLLRMEGELHKRIIGQEDAVRSV